MKIVINKSHGGFRVSKEFCEYYNIPYIIQFGMCLAKEDVSRTDKRLIDYIEKYGSRSASDIYSYLLIEEIPKGMLYKIDEYDGVETIIYRDMEKWEIAED